VTSSRKQPREACRGSGAQFDAAGVALLPPSLRRPAFRRALRQLKPATFVVVVSTVREQAVVVVVVVVIVV